MTEEKPYSLKKLSGRDIFIFSTILKQIGYSELKECFQSAELIKLISGKNKADEIGVRIMLDISTIVISNLQSAEDSIYQLLSNLSGMTKTEISKLDAEVFMEMVIDVFNQDGFKNFIGVVSRLFS